jgi:hypothetical protein
MLLSLTRVCIDLASTACTGMTECLGVDKGHRTTPDPTSAQYQVIEGDLAAPAILASEYLAGLLPALS